MASVVKASFQGIMKRLTYGTEEANFNGLVKTLKESFSIAEGAKLRILYTDSDGDKVLLSDNEDLKDALKNQKLNPLYLEMTIIQDAKPEAKTAAGGPSTDPLAALFGNMNNWTSSNGKESLDKVLSSLQQGQHVLLENIMKSPEFASSLKQGQQIFEKTMKDISPAGSSDLMAKFMAQVSAAVAAATDAAAAASSSKAQEKSSRGETKPAPAEKTAAEKTQEKEEKTEKGPEKEPEKDSSEENKCLHPGVQCDVCSMIPIKGTRYKSLDQHDYDLCQACMDAYPNKTEQFTRIEHPLYRPRGFGAGCRGGRGGPRGMGPGLQFGGRPFTCSNMTSNNRWGGRHWGGPSATVAEAKPDARFVKDVTIYDGTEMVPGTPFTKIWRFRNVGTTAWPQGTRILRVGGDSLAEQETFELQISENGLAPGEEVDVAANLTAPEKPGRYVTHFRLATPQGVRFGHRMWALIHVLDKDEESPLVADSKAEEASPAPSAPAAPAPEKEPVNETSDDVKVIPVEGADVNETSDDVKVIPVRGADVTTEETAVVVTPESPKSEPTNLGDDGFMKVDQSDTKSPEDSSPAETAIQAPAPTPLAADAPKTAGTASPLKAVPAAEDVSAEQVVPESVVWNKAPELYKEQLAKLAELGFDNGAQNVALLEKYDGDLPKTINDLVTVNEWDPMLQELEEMGFYDKELNRSLIYKNNGRLQRVVKDLVQIYKAGPKA